MNITIKTQGMLPQQFEKYIIFQFISIDNGIKQLGEETVDNMRNVIGRELKSHRGSRTGNLQKSINAYPISDGVGVGNINELNAMAPYWYIVNYGGMNTAAARGLTLYGSFEGNRALASMAGTGTGKQQFYLDGQFPMKPKNPIYAMNYIEKTIMILNSTIRIHFSNWTKRTKVHYK